MVGWPGSRVLQESVGKGKERREKVNQTLGLPSGQRGSPVFDRKPSPDRGETGNRCPGGLVQAARSVLASPSAQMRETKAVTLRREIRRARNNWLEKCLFQ